MHIAASISAAICIWYKPQILIFLNKQTHAERISQLWTMRKENVFRQIECDKQGKFFCKNMIGYWFFFS